MIQVTTSPGHMMLAHGIADVHQFRRGGIFKQKNAFFRRKPFVAQGAMEKVGGLHT